MPQQHYYKHLDKDKNCNVNIELNMEQLAQMVCKANYGLHRFISEVIDIKKRSEWNADHLFADELKKCIDKDYY